jgi:L-threonylcarbamoyladenylate synthase
MIILDYKQSHHKEIISSCVHALKLGKVVVYPTDTCYGLAVDATNLSAIRKLYQIKERGFNRPVHVVVPSLAEAKKISVWNSHATKLAKQFLPGPLTLVLELKNPTKGLKILSAKTDTIGIRMPNNSIALDLAKFLKKPITATSANPASTSGGYDSYTADEVVAQFKNQKYKPDIIINAGRLPKRKPSTLVRVFDDVIKIIREGPITEKQITKYVPGF